MAVMTCGRAFHAGIAAFLLLACGGPPHSRGVPAPVDATGAGAAESEYVTLIPEVTVSPAPAATAEKPAAIDENEDVMAGILAIPPGG